MLTTAQQSSTNLNFPNNKITTISKTLPTYASWNIDSSCNRGFHHINFTNVNLQAAAKGLSPSKLRFGGSGNDFLIYQFDANSNSCKDIPPAPATGNCSYFTDGCLNATHWNNLYQLAEQAESDFIFGVSFDLVQACKSGSSYEWNPDNAQELLRHIKANKQKIYGFELGNEINNHETTCNLTANQQASALSTFATILSNNTYFNNNNNNDMPKLIGPDTGYKNAEEWLKIYLPLAANSGLNAVTHHVYPGLNRETFNTPQGLDSSNDEIAWYVSVIKEYAPHSEIWAGEDGPKGGGNDGTCGGGDASICGLFASAMWFADDLGNRASKGFTQYQRQDFFGAAYGLTGSTVGLAHSALGVNDPLALRPGYWIHFLWKRLVGTNVLNITSNNPMIRSYAFEGLPPSKYAHSDCKQAAYTLVLINLQRVQPVSVNLPVVDTSTSVSFYTAWIVSPPNNSTSGLPDPFSQDILLNEQKLPQTVDVTNGKGAEFLQDIPIKTTKQTGTTIVLPPSSIAFVCVV